LSAPTDNQIYPLGKEIWPRERGKGWGESSPFAEKFCHCSLFLAPSQQDNSAESNFLSGYIILASRFVYSSLAKTVGMDTVTSQATISMEQDDQGKGN